MLNSIVLLSAIVDATPPPTPAPFNGVPCVWVYDQPGLNTSSCGADCRAECSPPVCEWSLGDVDLCGHPHASYTCDQDDSNAATDAPECEVVLPHHQDGCTLTCPEPLVCGWSCRSPSTCPPPRNVRLECAEPAYPSPLEEGGGGSAGSASTLSALLVVVLMT